MTREYEVIVKTPLRDVSLTIESHTTGKELFDNVMTSLSIVETQYFILQYKNKKGNYRDLLLKKKVLSIKNKTRESPLRFFLNVSVFPADPFSIQDFTAKFLIYRETEVLMRTGDLVCPKHVAKTLDELSRNESIDEYLRVVASLDEYGYSHFNVERADGMPCRLSLNGKGILVATGHSKKEISYLSILKIQKSRKAVTVKFRERNAQALIFYTRRKEDPKDILRIYRRHVDFSSRNNKALET
ncbi:moesin-like [Macrobrachium rosenbergii]|uniref:moesin-like n=1 Tax=Macrobrachium rosenbergii TaxID=79674 RepID=UPI0034D547EE